MALIGAVQAGEVTYQYFRFSPTAMNRAEENGTKLYGPIQLSEFTFSRGGQKLNINGTSSVGPSLAVTVTGGAGDPLAAEGAMKVVDGDPETKWFSGGPDPLVFSFPAPVTVDSYNFATANDFLDRTPVNWTLEGSTDKAAWVPIDLTRSTGANIAPRYGSIYTYQAGFAITPPGTPTITSITALSPAIVAANTPINLGLVTNGATSVVANPGNFTGTPTAITITPPQSGTYTITATNSLGSNSATIPLKVVVPDTLNYRYVRYTPVKLRGTQLTIQLAEFEFYNGATKVPVTTVESPGSNNPAGELPAKLIDGIVNVPGNKYLDFNRVPVIFDFGSAQTFNSYQFYTGGDAAERTPIRWTLEGSNDKSTWTMIENVTAYDYPTNPAFNTASGKLPFFFRAAAAPTFLTWTGSVDANWNKTTPNFSGAQTVFTDGSNVLFNDTAAIKAVNVAEQLVPGIMNISSSSAYSFGGDTIYGPGSLNKTGTGALSLLVPTALRGDMVLGGGKTTATVLRALGDIEAPGKLAVNNGELEIPTSQFSQRPLEINTGTLNVADEATFTHVGPLSYTGTLTKTGPGSARFIALNNGSATTAASTLIVNEGTVEFATGYFNRAIFGGNNRFTAVVNPGATLLGSESQAFGGDYAEFQVAINQIRVNEGTFELNGAGTQYFPSGLITPAGGGAPQGRIVLKGAVVVGSTQIEPARSIPNTATGPNLDGTNASRTVVTVEASAVTTLLDGGGNITTNPAAIVFDVADGEAAEDLLVNKSITGNYGFIKEGPGNMALYTNGTYVIVKNTYIQGIDNPNNTVGFDTTTVPPKAFDLPHGTTVRGGTLTLSNLQSLDTDSATGKSEVRIVPGATLAGLGFLTGHVDLEGFVAPGDVSIESPTGELTVGSTKLTGTYKCDVIGSSADVLNVKGVALTTGSSGDLVLTGSTLQVSASTAVAGTYVIAKYTGTRTGTFATPSLPAGASVSYDDTAKEIRLTVTDGTAPTGFAGYIAAAGLTGANAAPTADPDSDGLTNLIEFVVGGSPTVSSQANAPTMVRNPNGDFVFTFRRTTDSASLNPGVEYSVGLTGTWTAAAPANVVVEAGGFGAGVDKVTVTLPATLSSNGKLFARLKAVL